MNEIFDTTIKVGDTIWYKDEEVKIVKLITVNGLVVGIQIREDKS